MAAVLDDMLCFSLYAASRAMTAAYRPVLEPLGLTYPQYLVLVALWSEGTQTVGDLGDRLALDSGTLSPLLRRLETRGLIERTRRPADERVVEVALTEEGLRMRDEMDDVQPRIFSCTGLDLHSAQNLISALHVLTEGLRTTPEATAS